MGYVWGRKKGPEKYGKNTVINNVLKEIKENEEIKSNKTVTKFIKYEVEDCVNVFDVDIDHDDDNNDNYNGDDNDHGIIIDFR